MTSDNQVISRSKSRSALENKNKRKSLQKSSTSTVLREANSNLCIFEEKQKLPNSLPPLIKEPFVPKRTLSKSKAKIDLKSVTPIEKVLSTSKTAVNLNNVLPTECRKFNVETKSLSKSISKSRTSARLSSIAEMNAVNEQLSKTAQQSKSLSKSKTSVKLESSRVLSKCKTSAKLPLQISKVDCDKYTDRIVKKTEDCTEKISEPILTVTQVPEKSLKKQKTATKFKTDPLPKSFRKTRSQSLLPEEILLSKFVNIDISDEPKDQKKIVKTPPNIFRAGSSTKQESCVETPKTISKGVSEKLKRLTFSDVDFFYFNRTAGHSSVPRDGFNTIGMDMTHSHHQKLRFNLGQEPFVRKKLFHVDGLKKPAEESSDSNSDSGEKEENLLSASSAVIASDEGERKASLGDEDSSSVYRSSPRLNNAKSVSSLFSRSDCLRRSALQSSQSRKLAKFVSQVSVRSGLKESPDHTEDLHTPQLTPSQLGLEERSSSSGGVCGTRGLTPLSSKARCSILKAHGIFNIDRDQAEDIKTIRESRETCGCSCKEVCSPQSCECVINDIECQVEKEGFPCSCGVGCGNPNGRKVFDETEVSLHYINTMMSIKGSFVI